MWCRRDASSAGSAGTPRALWRDGSLSAQRPKVPAPYGAAAAQWLLLLGVAATIVLQARFSRGQCWRCDSMRYEEGYQGCQHHVHDIPTVYR